MYGRFHRQVIGLLLAASFLGMACDGCDAHDKVAAGDTRPVSIRLETSLGPVRCQLFTERAPHAVALITSLALEKQSFHIAGQAKARTGRYYDGLTFFRRIPNVMVQTGCPIGDGTGYPGFRIEAELHDDDAKLLEQPGALVMARYRAPPNRQDPNPPPKGHVIGSQFAITLRPMLHLAGDLPVVGRCQDLNVVTKLSQASDPPTLERLEVLEQSR